jgi:transposase
MNQKIPYLWCMFVRIKKSGQGTKQSVQLVSNTRRNGKVVQKVIRHIGTAFDEKELKALIELAEYIKNKQENTIQPTLFKAEALAEQINLQREKGIDEPSIIVDLKKLKEEQRVITGIHEVFGVIYRELGFEKCLTNYYRRKESVKNFYQLVMARTAHPASKRKSVIDLEKHFGVNLSLSAVYRMLDAIDDKSIEKINQLSYLSAKRLFKEEIQVVFYDCTTLYFESFTEDELKENGYSKDGVFNQPQVLLALLVTREGLPIGYEVYPGSTFEGNTLENAINKMRHQYEIKEVIFVADSGLLSDDNLKIIEKKGINYIVGARLKNLTKAMQNKVLQRDQYLEEKENAYYQKIKTFEINEYRNLIITHSKSRAEKDKHDREKAIEKLQKRLSKSKNPASLISNYGYKKYLQLNGTATIAVNQEKIKQSEMWDGLSGVITNCKQLTNNEIINHYHSLWQIEECFRISKHDLRIRPIFHWTPKRIKSHIALCFVSLVCIRHLMYRVKVLYQSMSPESIRQELIDVQSSVLKHIESNEMFVVPSKATTHAKRIYQTVGKKLTDVPFRLKIEK